MKPSLYAHHQNQQIFGLSEGGSHHRKQGIKEAPRVGLEPTTQ